MFQATCQYLKQRAHDPAPALVAIRIRPQLPAVVDAATTSATDYVSPDAIAVIIRPFIPNDAG